jgi:hypothetical protein
MSECRSADGDLYATVVQTRLSQIQEAGYSQPVIGAESRGCSPNGRLTSQRWIGTGMHSVKLGLRNDLQVSGCQICQTGV